MGGKEEKLVQGEFRWSVGFTALGLCEGWTLRTDFFCLCFWKASRRDGVTKGWHLDNIAKTQPLPDSYLLKWLRQWSWRKYMSQDVRGLLLFRCCRHSVFFRNRILRTCENLEYTGRVGRQPACHGPKEEQQHLELHRISPTAGQKLVSLISIPHIWCCLSAWVRDFSSDIPNIISLSKFAISQMPARIVWVQKVWGWSFGPGKILQLFFFFEYLKSVWLFKLSVLSVVQLLCFHCLWYVLKVARTSNYSHPPNVFYLDWNGSFKL